MPKYDMLCENCGIVEIQHSMHKDHPEGHECGGKMQRYFGGNTATPVHFISTRGGGIDDWSKQTVSIQHPTSEEAQVPYR